MHEYNIGLEIWYVLNFIKIHIYATSRQCPSPHESYHTDRIPSSDGTGLHNGRNLDKSEVLHNLDCISC